MKRDKLVNRLRIEQEIDKTFEKKSYFKRYRYFYLILSLAVILLLLLLGLSIDFNRTDEQNQQATSSDTIEVTKKVSTNKDVSTNLTSDEILAQQMTNTITVTITVAILSLVVGTVIYQVIRLFIGYNNDYV